MNNVMNKMCKITFCLLTTILMVIFLAGCSFTIDPEVASASQLNETTLVESGYIPVGDLNMYYEVHGESQDSEAVPLLVLHGGFMSIADFGDVVPLLAQTRQVIAVEQQGHGHTADIDRPLSYAQMAEDTAALLEALGIEQTDIFGYSDGGVVGLGLAIRHPNMVRKLAIAGANYNVDGLYPEIVEIMRNATPEDMEDLRPGWESVNPNPEDWPVFVEKIMVLGTEFPGWAREDMQEIQAPTLIIIGDADLVTPEHAVEMYRLIPNANLAVLPATDHFMFMRPENPERQLSMLHDFFTAPIPEAQ
jgi:pimeloyl-ACP methyl ester carboxylesterase